MAQVNRLYDKIYGLAMAEQEEARKLANAWAQNMSQALDIVKERYNESNRLFCFIPDYRDASNKIQQNNNEFQHLFQTKEDHHKDMLNQSNYDRAVKMMNSRDFDSIKQAGEIFKKMEGWRDADEKLRECSFHYVRIADQIYQQALTEEKKLLPRDLEKAMAYYDQIQGWRDADERRKGLYDLLNKRRLMFKIGLIGLAIIIFVIWMLLQ